MAGTPTSPRRLRRIGLGAAALATVAVAPLATSTTSSAAPWVRAEAKLGAKLLVSFGTTSNPTTDVHVLGFNDFHGHLETTSPGNLYGSPAGGSVFLAGRLRALQATYGADVATVHAGDAIGASPLVSGGFLDEPSILSMRRMNVDFASVGNHEFDKGSAELLRDQTGGCHPTKGCQYGSGNTTYPDGSTVFPGASGASAAGLKAFQYLSDNVIVTATGHPLFDLTPAQHVKSFPAAGGGTVKVGFIGETLQATPTIVTPTGVAGLTFQDEATTANALVPQLQAAGAQTIVLVVHQGGFQNPGAAAVNSCNGAMIDPSTGQPNDVLAIARHLDPAIKVIVSGHTHAEYNCTVNRVSPTDTDPANNIVITSASSFGRAISDIDLTIDNVTGKLVAANAVNTRVDRVAPSDDDGNAATFDQASIVNQYSSSIAPIANQIVGEITGAMPNTGATLPGTGSTGQPAAIPGEKPAGDLIADAQLFSTVAAPNSAQIALMNTGGVRDPGFTFPSSAAGEGDGKVTYGEAFTVQPFGNSLVTLTMTGAQLKTVLEQQFQSCLGQTTTRIMQPSSSFTYEVLADPNGNTLVDAGDCGNRIFNMKINGVAVQPTDSIRVTINNFLSTGGDGFTTFLQGTNLVGGAQDIDALVSYMASSLGAGPDFVPPAPIRIKAYAGPVPTVPESPLPWLLPLAGGVTLAGGFLVLRRRRPAAV